MKFRLTTSKQIYIEEDKEEIDFLSSLGFQFRSADEDGHIFIEDRDINGQEMAIEINSLQELIIFIQKTGCIVLSESHPVFDKDHTIEIYNDYRE